MKTWRNTAPLHQIHPHSFHRIPMAARIAIRRTV
nr:MAG TPA: hypothetical protein [Caudoviricetes sp.]